MIISRGGWPAPGRLTVLLRALAETPDLRLRVLVGEDALDRTVDGVFTTDLLDPRRDLTGGEVLPAAQLWRRAPRECAACVGAGAGGPAAPGPDLRSVLARGWLGAAGLPATVLADGVPYSLFGVTGQPAHRLAGWFLAVAGDQAGWDADRRAIAAELAAVAAGHRARHEEAQRAVRRAADGALRRVLDRPAGPHAPADPEIPAALRRCGPARCGPLVAGAPTAAPPG